MLIAIMVPLCAGVKAQNPVSISTDTLPCGVRLPNYYYGRWYDTTGWYQDPDNWIWNPMSIDVHFIEECYSDGFRWRAFQQYAPRPIRIKGLWAMVSQYAGPNPEDTTTCLPVRDSTRLPEYLYLYVRNPKVEDTDSYMTYFLTRIATVRWDTAQPKMMCVQKTADGRFPNMYCHVYEALLDTVHTIEGEYWIGGSTSSNVWPLFSYYRPHFPTFYVGIKSSTHGSEMRDNPYAHYSDSPAGAPDGPWSSPGRPIAYGPFGVITDGQRYVEVLSADSSQGQGLLTAFYLDSTYQTISAVASRGFRFSHWNDSVTDNPRTIFVTQDTQFTASFAPLSEYDVAVRSSDETMGYVEMGTYRMPQPGDVIHDGEEIYYVYTRRSDSVYYEGDTSKFRAVANEGNRFVRWNDSVTENPRRVVVTQDTLFVAYFERIPQYEVEVRSNDQALGYVTGGNVYYEGEVADIRAIAHEGRHFAMWHDSVQDNPRRIVVVQDTSFTAIFRNGPVGVQEVAAAGVNFRLVPNPATEEVRCLTAGEEFDGGVLKVVDAAGREVLRRELPRQTQAYTFRVADYPSGTYFVTLTTAKGTSTQKLVVEN